MARLLTAGAEGDDLLEDLAFSGSSPVRSATVKRSGGNSWKCDTGSPATASYLQPFTISPSVNVGYWTRAYFYFVDLPAATTILIGASTTFSVRLTSGGKLQLFAGGSQVGSDSSATITTGQHYRIELYTKVSSASNADEAELRLDGTTVASTTTAEVSNAAGSTLSWGWTTNAPGTNKVCYIDDLAVNDDTGSAQNTWPGEGSVVLLLPTSDNARATLWTGGVGGTTNLYDAVNNVPPIGTASETDTTQIEHAGNSGGTTDAYDANMTTYTAAGVPSGATITLVQALCVHGEDVTTGAKLLAVSIVSNPAVSSSGNFTVGDATPSALGTYPTEWGFHRGTISYAPSVTLGTAPVMRVVRPETATRVASVCFMGIVVEYADTGPQSYTLTAAAGSYALTGVAATLRHGYVMPGAAGSYALSGQVATPTVQYRPAATTGSYSLTGQAAVTTSSRALTGEAGAYTLAGQAATLIPSKVLTAEAGAYALAGQAAALARQYRVTAEAGAYSVTGQAAGTAYARTMTAEAGNYLANGLQAQLVADRLGQLSVASGPDDATERADGLFFQATTNGINLDAGLTETSRWVGGFRFSGVPIPPGATVTAATIELTVQDAPNDSPNVDIFLNDVDNAANFVDEADVTSRVRTTASVQWTAASIGSGRKTSPDFSAVVQEVIDRAGWASGNALCVLIAGRSDAAATFKARSYEFAPTAAAVLLVTYTVPLPAAAGSYSLTGQAAGLVPSKILTAESGAYTLTGQAAGLTVALRLTAAAGSYAVTGQAANLIRGKLLTAEAGVYAVTGQAAGAVRAYAMVAASGSYTLSGQASGFLRGYALSAVTGAYVLTGKDAGLIVQQPGQFTLSAAAESYALSGQTAGLLQARQMAAAVGTYTVTGQTAILGHGYVMAGLAGSYQLTGVAALLPLGRVVTANAGAYTVGGQVAALASSRRLALEAGNYLVSGQAAALGKTFVLIGAAGTYAITGQTAGLYRAVVLSGAAGAYVLTGRSAVLFMGERPVFTFPLVSHAGSVRTCSDRDSVRLVSAGGTLRTKSEVGDG